MRSLVLAVGAGLVSLVGGLGPAWSANMVVNPGFEDGTAGWSLPTLYSIDATVARSGGHSLKYHNDAGGPYLIAGQGLPLKVGKYYRMCVWVKTERIASSDTGATISMEWSGKQGYIGGGYPPGVVGSSDWHELVFVTGPVPEGVTGGSVILYGRPDTNGTAWFDDVEVTELDQPLARFGFADGPPGEQTKAVWAGVGSPEVRVRAELAPEAGVSADSVALSATLLVAGAKVESTGGAWKGNVAEAVVSTAALPCGKTPLEVSLIAKADKRPLTTQTLTIEKRRLLSMDTVYPNSAGVVGVGPERDERLAVRVAVQPREPGKPRRYRARVSLLAGDKEVGEAAEAPASDGKPVRVALSLAGLPFGLLDLRCRLFAEGSHEPLTEARSVVTHADPSQRPANATWLGPNRMLMVEGKPFFPMGFYILSGLEGVLPADQPWRWQTGKLCPEYYLPILDRLSRSHFNCVMDYGSTLGGIGPARSFLDAAQARHVRAIFSVKDLMPGAFPEAYIQNLPWKDLREATRNVVREFREHPSVLAWYINDEVCRPELWQGAVNVFRDTRETDPWHPTWAVHWDYQGIGTYREACDVIGTDPYCLTGDIGFTARDWHVSREQMPPEQPFWAVVQCMGMGYEMSRPSDTREPTYDEERAATMAAIAEGSTGIIYYCFHSLQRSPRFEERFAELDRIAAEVQGLVPIIALPNAEKQATVDAGTLSALTKQGKDATYLILASTVREDQDVTLKLPVKAKSVVDVATGESLRADGDALKLRFKALDARVLKVR